MVIANKNGNTIGAVEKRELAKLTEAKFNTIISQMTQEMKYTEGEILEQAEKKFGIQYIDKEIKQLEAKIEMLNKQKEKLGFNTGHYTGFKKLNGYGDEIDPNTKAGRFFYLKMARNVDIQNIQEQRDSRLTSLWLTDSRSEVKLLVEAKPNIKFLDKPKAK